MTVIVKTIKAATQSNFKKLLEYIYADFDRFTVMFLTVSVFMPFYFTIASVCIVSVMIMVNCKKRTKAFSAPYTKFLFFFITGAFFIAAIYNNYAGMGCAVLCYAVVICGLYVRSVMTRGIFNQAMDIACVGSIWCLFIAVFQKASLLSVSPEYRPVSVFFNANYYGMIIEFIMIIALYRMFTNTDLAAFYASVIGLNFIGLYLTASFSSVMAMSCAVLVMLILKRKYIPASLFTLCGAMCVLAFFFFPQLLPRGSEALDHTLAQRLSIWGAAVQGIKQHPFFGQGAMSYWMICEKYGSYRTFHCHNLFLDILLNYGIFGFAAIVTYALVQLKLLFMRVKSHIYDNMNILAIAAVVAVAVHGMTDVTIFSVQTGALFLAITSSMGISSAYFEKDLALSRFIVRYKEKIYARAPFAND
mgnify:FL=1